MISTLILIFAVADRKAMSAQMPTKLKLALCDMPLNNDASVEELHGSIANMVDQLRLGARSHPCSFLHKRSRL